MSSEVLATCIIPTCGHSQVLSSLLEELERQLQSRPQLYEVIVVGDRVVPPSTSTLAKCVIAEGEGGISATRNYGAKLATTPWLIFLDDDVIPNASWATVLEKFLKEYNCDLAGGGLDIYPLEYRDILPSKYHYLFGEKIGLNDKLGKFEYIAGGHLLVKKLVYEKLGCFSEKWGYKDGNLLPNEDVILQVLYRKHYNKPILYLDELRCNHYVRPEQTHRDYLINRLQSQGKADVMLDSNYYPIRAFLKFIYYQIFCLINHPSETNLSLKDCNWYRSQSYLMNFNKFYLSKG